MMDRETLKLSPFPVHEVQRFFLPRTPCLEGKLNDLPGPWASCSGYKYDEELGHVCVSQQARMNDIGCLLFEGANHTAAPLSADVLLEEVQVAAIYISSAAVM